MTSNDISEQCYDVEILDKDGNTLYTNINNNGYEKYKDKSRNSHSLVSRVIQFIITFITSILSIILGGISLVIGVGVVLISTAISIVFVLFKKLRRR